MPIDDTEELRNSLAGMFNSSPFIAAGRGLAKGGEAVRDTATDLYNRATSYFPSRPNQSGQGDIQLPRDRYSKRNFDPAKERRRKR